MVKDVAETVVSKRDVAFSHRPAWAVPNAMPQVRMTEIVTAIIVRFMGVIS